MESFEPSPEWSAMPEPEEKLARLAQEYTDDQILLEARRRGLLMRVEAQTVAPSYAVEAGFPLAEQIVKTMDAAAYEAAKTCLSVGRQPRGMKVDLADDPGCPYGGKHRRVRIPLNFVVERKAT